MKICPKTLVNEKESLLSSVSILIIKEQSVQSDSYWPNNKRGPTSRLQTVHSTHSGALELSRPGLLITWRTLTKTEITAGPSWTFCRPHLSLLFPPAEVVPSLRWMLLCHLQESNFTSEMTHQDGEFQQGHWTGSTIRDTNHNLLLYVSVIHFQLTVLLGQPELLLWSAWDLGELSGHPVLEGTQDVALLIERVAFASFYVLLVFVSDSVNEQKMHKSTLTHLVGEDGSHCGQVRGNKRLSYKKKKVLFGESKQRKWSYWWRENHRNLTCLLAVIKLFPDDEHKSWISSSHDEDLSSRSLMGKKKRKHRIKRGRRHRFSPGAFFYYVIENRCGKVRVRRLTSAEPGVLQEHLHTSVKCYAQPEGMEAFHPSPGFIVISVRCCRSWRTRGHEWFRASSCFQLSFLSACVWSLVAIKNVAT